MGLQLLELMVVGLAVEAILGHVVEEALQFRHAIQDFPSDLKRSILHLQEGHPVLNILLGGSSSTELALQLHSDRQSSCIISGRNDSLAAG